LAEAYYALGVLESAGLVVEHFESAAGEAAYWFRQGVHPDAAAAKLASARWSLKLFGDFPYTQLEQSFRRAGLPQPRPTIADSEVVAIVADDYLRPDVGELAAAAREKGAAVFLVRPNGDSAWIGPVFEAEGKGCWRCLAARLDLNRSRERIACGGPEGAARIKRARSGTPLGLAIAAGQAAQQLALRLAGGAGTGPGLNLITCDNVALETRRHPVQALPQCGVCGEPELASRSTAAIELRDLPDFAANDAGTRTRPVADTVAACEHLVSPITGIIDDLIPVEGAESVLDVPVLIGLVAEPFTRTGARFWESRILAAGKGTTALQARASVLCEAVERHSSCFRGDEPRREGRHAEFGGAAIHPADLLQFSDKQYSDAAGYNAAYSHPKYWVPDRFDDDRVIDWSEAWSLTGHGSRWVPTALCYFGYKDPRGQRRFARADSNGAAAGNTTEEAILQGLLELIERDACAVWWFNRALRPALDLEGSREPFVQRALQRYASAGRELWVLDLTSDLQVPVYAAVSRQAGEGAEAIVYGFGCHLQPRIALLRAITECDQSLVAALRLERNTTDHFDQDRRRWLREGRLRDHLHLAPDEAGRRPVACDAGGEAAIGLRSDIETLVARVKSAGSDVIALDMSRPDMPLSVVKMIAPGLCHPWRRLGSERLFQLPVRLGWLDAPRSEAEINPAVKL
jgi:ribosomal protein S12 methylthiotransferase accessory factor